MKTIINFCLLIVMTINIAYSQNTWGNWVTVYSEGSKTIQISFKYCKWGNTCYPKGGGYHFYRIKNDFNEKVGGTILFDNTDCDGKNYTNNAPFNFEGAAIDQEMGMWFLGQSGTRNIHLRKAPDFYERKNKASSNNDLDNLGHEKSGSTANLKDNSTKPGEVTNDITTTRKGTETKSETGKTKDDKEELVSKDSKSKTVAQLEQERQEVRLKYVKDSTYATWKERNNRVEQHKEQQQEKAAIAAGVTAGVAALMLSNVDNSKIHGKRTYFKVGAFVGMNNIPAYQNMESPEVQSMNYTSVSSHSPFFAQVDLQTMLYKSKLFSLEITPYGQYGMTFMGGDNGTYMGYGGTGTLTFGNKIKLYGTAGYENRTGENTYDSDAALESTGFITNTKAIGTLSYDYSVISYGAGFMFDTNKADEENQEDKFLQIGAIIHQPSISVAKYSPEQIPTKMLLGGQFKWVLGGGFTFAAEYIPDYPVAGETTFQPISIEKQDYWNFKIGKTFNLSSSK